MLTVADRIVLADGVRVDGSEIEDHVRQVRAPINATGAFVVTRLDRPLGSIARELAGRYGIGGERAVNDVLAFAWHLNRTLFANVVPGGGWVARVRSRLGLAVRLVPAGRLPAARTRRFGLDTSTVLAATASAARATAGRGAGVGCLVTVLALDAAVSTGSLSVAPLVVGAAVGASIVVHECGHAAALRGVPAALVLSGPRTFVVHAVLSAGRASAVAAAGPCAASAVAAFLVLGATVAGTAVLALAGVVFAAHGVCLTIATREGRGACGL